MVGDFCVSCRYYSATIIKMSGVENTSTAIWLASVTAFVNFAFTFIGLFLVDRVGRRPLTLGSLSGEQHSSLRKYCVYCYDEQVCDHDVTAGHLFWPFNSRLSKKENRVIDVHI